MSAGLIAGSVIGGVVLLILAIIFAIYGYRLKDFANSRGSDKIGLSFWGKYGYLIIWPLGVMCLIGALALIIAPFLIKT